MAKAQKRSPAKASGTARAKKAKAGQAPAKAKTRPRPQTKIKPQPKIQPQPKPKPLPKRIIKPTKAAGRIKPPKPKKDWLAICPASPRDRKLVKQCAEVIWQLQPGAEIIFFGSRARGRAEEESDLDLLVLTELAISFHAEMRLLDAVFPLEFESGVIICPLVEERNRWYSDRYQAMPLARAITKHGVKL